MKIIKGILMTLFILAMIDVFILFASLSQIALEGRTGEWNGFWRTQAQAVVWIQNKLQK